MKKDKNRAIEYLLHLLILVGIYTMLAQSLNLAAGFGGMISLAHAGFYGVGAYTAAILAVNYHIPFLYVLPLAMLISGLLALIVSAIAIRTVDDYFIICTLGIQVVVFSLMNNWMALTRGPLGIPGIWGSVFTAAFLVFLPEMLRFVGLPNSIAANLRQIIYGTILIFTMFRYSQGFHAGIFLNCSEGNRKTVP